MSDPKPGFIAQVREFPGTFFTANTIEIFERMAWYGMFSLLPLYLTDPRAKGGLAFTEEDSSLITGIATFMLYLMPVVTGALADRYGYKKMFLLAFSILTPAYWLLGQLNTFWTFLAGFLFLAVGAAIFKPVVVGTVARTSSERNSQLAFGIFYMMVNIGGFVGPWITGILRGPDPVTGVSKWPLMFTACAGFIAVNFIWVLFFYKEPTSEAGSATKRTLGKVLADAVDVLGNARFFVCAFGTIIIIFIGGKKWIPWDYAGYVALGWLGLNLLIDLILRSTINGTGKLWFLQPMKLSNWRFAVYLLILSGFWTSFNQIIGAGTIQWYVRDFVQTRPLLDASVKACNAVGLSQAGQWIANRAESGGQVNPEWMSNLDPAFIVIFQLAVSVMVARLGRFRGIIAGTLVAAIGLSLPFIEGPAKVGILTHSVWITVLMILVFAIGEMAASPTSQEYIGNIAPKDKIALYMGYYFVAVALGNLFGNVLGGNLYGALARDRGRPDLMWLIFGGVAVLTAAALALYNRYALPRPHSAE